MKKQILNLAFVSIISVVFLSAANAAPTVKKLGTSNMMRANTTATTKSDAAPSARVSTVRLKPATGATIKPATITKTEAVKASTEGEAARLSLGKYLHNTSVVKPGSGSSASAEAATSGIINRIDALEQGKQDKLTAGPGIQITGNVITSRTIPAGETEAPTGDAPAGEAWIWVE